VYRLEEKLAATQWSEDEQQDPSKLYHKMTFGELAKLAPGLPWQVWIAEAGLARETAIDVVEPSATTGAAGLVRSEPLAVWKDYLAVRTLSVAAPNLPGRFVGAHFEMYGKTLTGMASPEPRWKRGMREVVAAIPDAVGKLYVAKFFTPEAKASADRLVHGLLASMARRIDRVTWMSDATKAKAKAKLAAYVTKIGYPMTWKDYSTLEIVAGDAVGNALRGSAFEYHDDLAHLGRRVDRSEWGMTPMTVNAYYNPSFNEIVYPAAFLQPPLFDATADDAASYGAIGAAMAHEISHGFDDQGSQFDASGNMVGWWAKTDAAGFKAATTKLIAQYNEYCPVAKTADKPAQCVNGELTLSENIADLSGLEIAYDAYHLALGGRPAPTIGGLTGDQRFFISWAQMWRRLYRAPELAKRLIIDPHSPGAYRALAVRNVDAWYAAFDIRPSDALYLPPERRVTIW
jgi:putative endopeptidase